ncbi:MAG: hypothetical protein H8E44_29090 [Planctomycetes bacterium]|nr:hypothetical protein [Planctomycetota bacterium]
MATWAGENAKSREVAHAVRHLAETSWDGNLQQSSAQMYTRLAVLALVIVLLSSLYPLLAGSTYRGSADVHATIETTAALLGLIAGFSLVARFYALGNRLHLLIGLAFFVNAAEDFVHGLLAFEAYQQLTGAPSSSLAQFIPGTYVAGRLCMGLILLSAPCVKLLLGESPNPQRETKWVSIAVLLVSAAVTIAAFHVPLPKFIFPDRFISRPVDLLSAIVLVLALAMFLWEYCQRRDMLTWWIALSIATNVVGQVFMSFSKQLSDPFFDIAHVYKVLGYAVPLVGFCLYQTAILTERKRAERELAELNRRLIDSSRQAGMAEVATGVLHNVGNVLNSVNVSANLMAEKVKNSRVIGLAKASELIEEHADDLATFITSDYRGKQLPAYLSQLAERLVGERDAVLEELGCLIRNVDHIKEIVSLQQSFANVAGVVERIDLADTVDSALKINDAGLFRHGVVLNRDYTAIPPVTTDRHKVLQILVNLISNAKYALSDSARGDKRLTIRIGSSDVDRVKVEVLDNGVGITGENLSRIFQHGFTTKKHGHGFGLHCSALAAKELGGTLSVRSDGPGRGATFTLELPLGRSEDEAPISKKRPAPPTAQPIC